LHDKAASGSGAGLGNIRNRINVLNGEISFTRGEYRGVFVKIKIPCKYLVRRNDTDE
jgi:signal transduction histidine kinase